MGVTITIREMRDDHKFQTRIAYCIGTSLALAASLLAGSESCVQAARLRSIGSPRLHYCIARHARTRGLWRRTLTMAPCYLCAAFATGGGAIAIAKKGAVIGDPQICRRKEAFQWPIWQCMAVLLHVSGDCIRGALLMKRTWQRADCCRNEAAACAGRDTRQSPVPCICL